MDSGETARRGVEVVRAEHEPRGPRASPNANEAV
jgi:hypothetical protein